MNGFIRERRVLRTTSGPCATRLVVLPMGGIGDCVISQAVVRREVETAPDGCRVVVLLPPHAEDYDARHFEPQPHEIWVALRGIEDAHREILALAQARFAREGPVEARFYGAEATDRAPGRLDLYRFLHGLASREGIYPHFTVSADSRRRVDAQWREQGLIAGTHALVAIHCRARPGDAGKNPDPDRLLAVAKALRAKPDVRILVLGAEDVPAALLEVADARDVGQSDPSLQQPAAWIESCALYLGGDSGPTHLAAAVGTPVVVVAPPGRALTWGPFAPPHRLRRVEARPGDSAGAPLAFDVEAVLASAVALCPALAEPHADLLPTCAPADESFQETAPARGGSLSATFAPRRPVDDSLRWVLPSGHLGDALILSSVLRQWHDRTATRFGIARVAPLASLFAGHPAIAQVAVVHEGAVPLAHTEHWAVLLGGPNAPTRPFGRLASMLFGQPLPETPPWAPVHDCDRRALRTLPFSVAPVLLAPAANHDLARWPAAHWAEFAVALGERCKAPIVQLGHAAERTIPGAINVSGKLSPREMLALAGASQACVSVDPFVNAAARMHDLPTLALYGPTDPDVEGFPGQVQLQRLGCSDCHQPCLSGLLRDSRTQCRVGSWCLAEISPSCVLRAFELHLGPRIDANRPLGS